MIEMIAGHLDTIAAMAPTWGFVLIFVFMAVESSFIPFPSEVVMIPAGFLAARGELMHGGVWLSLVLAIVIGIIGSILGAFVNYYLALWLGRPFLEKYGRYFFIKPEPLARACDVFNRYGAATTFVCRLVPVIRQLISIPAGISRMKLLPFTCFTALGAGIWTAVLAGVGFAIGSSVSDITYLDLCLKGKAMATEYLPWLIVGAAILAAAYFVVRRRMKGACSLLTFVAMTFVCGAAAPLPNGVLDLVDTKIGTAGGGDTTPAAVWPFGMVQPGPDTVGAADGDYGSHPSGYDVNQGWLLGFTQTHLSGTGCTDLMDFLLLPYTGNDAVGTERITRKLDHASEVARPGYYAVSLEEGTIKCELTATRRVAYHRYTFAKGGKAKIFLDTQAGSFAWWRPDRPTNRVVAAESTFDAATGVFEGHNRVCCWNDDRDIFAKIAFSPKPSAVRELKSNGRAGRRYVLEYDLPKGGAVVAKAAISSVDAEGARLNFEEDAAGFDFDARLAECRAAWRAVLGRIAAADYTDDGTPSTGISDRLINFYTALYHTMVQPNLFSDADGRVRFADQAWGHPFTGKVRKAKGFDAYTTFSTWDTFRATHPWYTLFNTAIVNDFCHSMMLSYSAIGKLPIWQMFGGENYCMPGVHSIPVIADALLKGITDVDPMKAARAMDVSLVLRFAEAPDYDKLGYWAYEIGGASVSRTLECGIDDWSAMKVAELAQDRDMVCRYEKRAGYYKNLFDPKTGCMRAKNRHGKFREPFDPYKQKPTEEDKKNKIPNDYTEGGAWQYAFHVLQDPSGLMKLHGGPDRLGEALEKLFTDNTAVSAEKATGECSGCIGQFALGNEHDQHVPYLFQLAGRPDRTEEIVRELCDRYFHPTVGGICGNDDCGQISAWYLFACLGFYPVNPVGGDYFLGAPQLARIAVTLENGKTFTVVAKGISKKNKYVKSVTLNGKIHAGMILKHSDIMSGGELVFEMSPAPRKL